MKKVNLNLVAKLVSDVEGGRVNLSIAQIKEVMKCYNLVLRRNFKASQIMELIER